ncbi:MAG: PTS sugar transporter subunit IIA [Treponema sp.]|nr:PTS sugar transporter subunit IIA [Treponema sp.]
MSALSSDLLNEDCVMMNVRAENKEDLLAKICEYACKKGYVEDGYLTALLERENEFPTGLPTEIIKVAVPHAIDNSRVIKSGIFIARLAEPIAFKEMGDGENDVMAEIIFLLVIKSGEDQGAVLKSIMGMFADTNALSALKPAETPREIIEVILNRRA